MMRNFSHSLLIWYNDNRRPLPWRSTTDPYKIWLSEIILQQTRVEQGMSYYHNFINRYPDVFKLAAAHKDEVLKLWQGLGYYTRARNLHKAARVIVESCNGVFPENYENLIKLPGVGPYTAAAIASIAFNEPVAAIDGNVKRVVSRLNAINMPIDRPDVIRTLKNIAENLMDVNAPGEFNQAMMELGAKVCIPRNPACNLCPVAVFCEALRTNKQKELPVKKVKVKKRTRYFYYFIFLKSKYTHIYQRGPNDIWEGLYEFPMIELTNQVTGDEILNMAIERWYLNPEAINEVTISPVEKHVLTHQNIYATFVKVTLSEEPGKLNLNINKSTLKDYPVSRLTEIYLNKDKKLL